MEEAFEVRFIRDMTEGRSSPEDVSIYVANREIAEAIAYKRGLYGSQALIWHYRVTTEADGSYTITEVGSDYSYNRKGIVIHLTEESAELVARRALVTLYPDSMRLSELLERR